MPRIRRKMDAPLTTSKLGPFDVTSKEQPAKDDRDLEDMDLTDEDGGIPGW